VATYTDTDHSHRFDVYYQVMCGERVSERCYWELEWNGDVGISVSYTQKNVMLTLLIFFHQQVPHN